MRDLVHEIFANSKDKYICTVQQNMIALLSKRPKEVELILNRIRSRAFIDSHNISIPLQVNESSFRAKGRF